MRTSLLPLTHELRKRLARVPPLAGRDWCYRLACTDGPVFRGAELLW